MHDGKGVVLYDALLVRGGAEKVTEALLNNLAQTELWTAGVSRDNEAAIEAHGVRRLCQWVILVPEMLRPVVLLACFSLRYKKLGQFKWALFSGIYAPVAVKARAQGRNFLYVHAIPRFCFELRGYYTGKLPPAARPLFSIFRWLVARQYGTALSEMSVVLANSENVRNGLMRHFQQPSVVVHPPVAVDRFRWLGDGDYYISLARLEPLKRVDVLICAFKEMPWRRLVVTSGGSAEAELKALAAGATNIEFTGWLSEDRLAELVGRARAAMYVPINEDFGISPVEAMAAGKPVIGVAEGGMLETVIRGRTGVLIEGELSPPSVCAAVRELEEIGPQSMRAACEERAEQFSADRFVEKIRALVETSKP